MSGLQFLLCTWREASRVRHLDHCALEDAIKCAHVGRKHSSRHKDYAKRCDSCQPVWLSLVVDVNSTRHEVR